VYAKGTAGTAAPDNRPEIPQSVFPAGNRSHKVYTLIRKDQATDPDTPLLYGRGSTLFARAAARLPKKRDSFSAMEGSYD
jgi:hypothetical protein